MSKWHWWRDPAAEFQRAAQAAYLDVLQPQRESVCTKCGEGLLFIISTSVVWAGALLGYCPRCQPENHRMCRGFTEREALRRRAEWAFP